jgi:hypothetical protein
MTNADWWARVQARTEHDDLIPRRIWTLRNGSQEAASICGQCREIVLVVDGEWRKTRLFRAHEQAKLSAAIADTRATFETKGWASDTTAR